MSHQGVGFRSERGPVLLAGMLATGLVSLEGTIVATAVPSIVSDLGGFEAYPWLFSAYLLAQAVLTPIYSKLADVVGRKPVLLFGIAVFVLGSVLCALAPSMVWLIVFRVVQGVGAGAILPLVMTITGDLYTIQERPRVQGYIGSVWAVSSVLGPVLGGLFAQTIGWPWIFWINVPLAALAGWLLLRGFREQVQRRSHRIDYAGAALLTVALTLLLLGILEGGVAWEWGSPISVGLFAGAAVAFVVFVLVERRAAEPVLSLGVITRRIVLVTSLTAAGVGIITLGVSSFAPTYLQTAAGADPLVAGLAVGALTLGWPIASTLSGHLYLRLGFRFTILLGSAVALLGAIVLVLAGPTPHVALVAVASGVLGIGLGFSASPGVIVAQASVPWHERGVVTGLNAFLRTLGSTIGVAVLGSLSNSVIAAHGGDESDPETIVAATTVVFVAVAIAAALMLVTAWFMPRDRVPRSDASPVAPDPAP